MLDTSAVECPPSRVGAGRVISILSLLTQDHMVTI